MNTIQELQEKVEAIKIRGKALMDADSDIVHIKYSIEEVPYTIFEEYRIFANIGKPDHEYITATHLAGRMYYWLGLIEPIQIYIYSKQVKFKHTYEVVEEI